MNSIAQKAKWKQKVLLKIQKEKAKGNRHAVSQAAIYFRIACVKTIYDWLKRWDGTWQSLLDRSHKPKSHPKQHTDEEIQLIIDIYREKPSIEPLLLWQELKERGYTRSFGGMKRFIRKKFGFGRKKIPKNKPKLYHGGTFPGEKLQLDVKFMPSECNKSDRKMYQYTAIDEYSRWCYREIYDEHSTYSAFLFLINLIKNAPFPIKGIQTDNGTEWTNALLVVKAKHKTLFEEALERLKIKYNRIRIATPRHNGRVERQHRIDQKRFYDRNKFYSLIDAQRKVKIYNKYSNSRIKTCLNFKTPDQVVEKYMAVMM
jgi:transposase InsO family protein